MRRFFIFVAAVFTAAAVIGGSAFAQSRPTPRDAWERLLREQIKLPEGYQLEVFARDLGTPRMMQMTAGGDLIVSGYRSGYVALLKPDADGDGRSDGLAVPGRNMNLPHGLLLEGSSLFVAEVNRVVKYDFDGKALSNARVILDGIPEGGHSSRTLARGPDGFLYLSIGSSCNACVEDHPWRAAMLRFKEGSASEIFASGLRNTVGFDWRPATGALYGVDNGRDNMGDDVPDDEVNLIEQGKHYGWPFWHGSGVEDPDVFSQKPEGLAATNQAFGLGGHVAPLSIVFLKNQADTALNGSALVGEHGSWNRTVKSGYRIMRLVFEGGSIREEPFLTGCEMKGEVICRPVGILEACDGSLYVSDDYAGAVYRISKSASN
jgi:glucose/arabinose dehydrogenase